MAKRFKKILVMAVIFTMTLVNYGLPLQAIASEGESLFNFAFFRKNEIALDAYFGEDSDDIEEVKNVNDTAKITLEVSPLIEGYLKSGSLKFNLKNGNENNFKLESVALEEKEELELDEVDTLMLEEKDAEKEESSVENEISDSEVVEEPETEENMVTENIAFEEIVEEVEAVDSEETTEKDKNSISDLFNIKKDEDEVSDSEVVEEPETEENIVTEDIDSEEIADEVEAVEKENVEEKNESEDEEAKESDELSEEEIIKQARESYEVSLASDNEIALTNIIDSTKIFVEVSYKQSESINPEDLFSEIEIVLEGNYINKKLETLDITRKQELTLGWEYSKEIEVTSDFAKVSPFTVGKNSGTIIENVVTITRNVEENNFLPIKQTNIKIEIPKINDKLPIAVNVAANKLMATLGKELTGKEFTKDNWFYDEETGILEISVSNNDMLAGNGEDKFDIICRYEDYYEEEKINLDKKLLVQVEEYSSNENRIQEKQVNETQEKEVIAGELMSYAAIENEATIGKGKINANYHIDAEDTKFSSMINVTVLTSDILDEVLIEPIRETYINKDGVEFDATSDVMYSGVRFNFAEIKEMLAQGSTIDLLDGEGNVFHTITKDVDATKIEFANKIDTVKVRINDVKVNGNLSIEFVKTIGKCQYSVAEFAGFEKIENTYKAEVKYVGFEDIFQLSEVKDEIKFTNTITQVNLLMNKAHLSTIYENENIEFKIDLINNLETSDLYKNPSFELVFPSFIKEVKLNNIYTLYQNGLSIRDYQVVNENGINKIIINLDGIQNGFNFSDITNGTNIIINTNLVVDEITPQKQDEVRLYYCNEAVTNYQTQANWRMSKPVPEGILKDTNGYDATTFEYQAPSGMIAINSITNYDGTGQTIKSFNQGEIIQTIPIKGENHIATMELSVLNNTGNDCTDVVLLGRIPFKGNKDLETGEDLGTNVDTVMKTILIPSEVNTNTATIYYSNNVNADKDLNKEGNGWSSTYTDPESIKSFMIVVDGIIEPGGILKYKYDFEIPANLGYEVKMLGSFGAFYNSVKNNVIMYETEIADRVGLITEAGAKYEASMSVNIGNESEVGEYREVIYTVKVKNTGSIDLTNIKIENKKPNFGEIKNAEDKLYDTSIYYIDKLLVGEEKEKEIIVKTTAIPTTLEAYVATIPNILVETDEEGKTKFYTLTENNEKVYITEMPEEFYIENFATVYVDDTINGVKTNTVKNKLVDSKFDIEIEEFNHVGDLNPGESFKYIIDVYNISEETIDNVVVEYFIPKELKYLETESYIENTFTEEFDNETNLYKISIDKLEAGDRLKFAVHCEVATKNIGQVEIENRVIVTADDIKEESDVLLSKLLGPELIVKQETNIEDNVIKEMEKFDIAININNNGKADSKKINFEVDIPKELSIVEITSEGKRLINYSTNGNIVTGNLYLLEPQSEAVLIIKVKSNPLNEGETNSILEVNTKVLEEYIGNLEVNPLSITIIDNPDRDLTEEEKKEEEDKNTVTNPNTTDDYKQNIEDTKNNETENGSNNTDDNVVQEIRTYKITGKVWKDENKNNVKDSNEDGIKDVQVSVFEGATKIKTVVTDSLGKFRFTELPIGNYTVVFEYDGAKYVAAQYKLANTVESENSDAIESESGIAVTDMINLRDSDVEMNLGLQNRDTFDISVQKYITKAIINTNGKEKVETYDDKNLAKLEIRSKELKNTTIELEYKIVVTNNGNVEGTVGMVRDYLPDALTFNQKENSKWTLGTDGVLYNEELRSVVIRPGESKELKLVLNKVMTEDNTGTISNKVEISKLSNKNSLNENSENNVATQEMIITISTGRTISIAIMITTLVISTVLIYGIKTGKIKRTYK